MKELTPEQLEIEKAQEAAEEFATQNCILKVVSGSHAYGTNIEGSDWDERGIYTESMEKIILPFEKTEQIQFRVDDVVLFELSKFMPLLLTQNPNVIELLWTDKSDILHINDMGQLLLDNRKSFLTQQVKESYVGYSLSQLRRIKGHNKWINNPQPEKAPVQSEFLSVVWNYTGIKEFNKKSPTSGYVAIHLGDNNYSLWRADRFDIKKNNWIDSVGRLDPLPIKEFSKINTENFPPDIIVKFNQKLFEDHFNNWKNYWLWKKNRNVKRSELEVKFGYDVKHAMHLIRLLRSGLDILKNESVPVKRDDAQFLLDIRHGKYTYDEIVKESEKLIDEINVISSKTNLPLRPNYDLAKEIMLTIYQHQWKLQNKKENKPKM